MCYKVMKKRKVVLFMISHKLLVVVILPMALCSSAPGMIVIDTYHNRCTRTKFRYTSVFVGFCSAISVIIPCSPCIVDSTST